LGSCCDSRLVVASERNAAEVAELPEIFRSVAGDAHPSRIASVAVVGAGLALVVVEELPRGAVVGGRQLALVLRKVVGHGLAGRAVALGQALGAAGGTLGSHRHAGLVVAGLGDAPRSFQNPEVGLRIAAQAVVAAVAGQAVVGAGHTGPEVVELPRTAAAGTDYGGIGDALPVLEVVAIVAVGAVGGGGAESAALRTGRCHSLVVLVVTGDGDASHPCWNPVVEVGVAAEAVAAGGTVLAVEGTKLAVTGVGVLVVVLGAPAAGVVVADVGH
jgi:hypothetical protein